MDFRLMDWKVLQGQKGTLDVPELKLGTNTISYQPTTIGTHVLAMTIGIEGDEDNQQTTQCTIEVSDADYTIKGEADAQGHLVIRIADAPEELHGGQWTILEATRSQGLEGKLQDNRQQLQYGDNRLTVVLNHIALEEPPALHMKIKGPDEKEVSITIDLTEACIAQLGLILASKEDESKKYIENIKDACKEARRLDNSNINAKRTKRAELENLLEKVKYSQTQYQNELDALKNNLNWLPKTLQLSRGSQQAIDNAKKKQVECNKLNDDLQAGIQALVSQIHALKDLRGASEPTKALFRALEQGDEESITLYLQDPNLDVGVVDKKGKALLQLAVETRNQHAVTALLGRGADIHQKYQTENLLHVALHEKDDDEEYNEDDIQIIKQLLDAGIDVNARNVRGDSPLHYAVFSGQPQIVKMLLDAGADKDAKNNDGNSVLYSAVCAVGFIDDLSTVELLLDYGTSLHAKNNMGENVLWAAVNGGIPEEKCMHFLLLLLQKDKGLLESRDNRGWTILHQAAYNCGIDMIKLFLENGADINAKDNNGRTPLFSAINIPTVELLIERGANVNAIDNNNISVYDCFSHEAYRKILRKAGAYSNKVY